MFVSPKPAHAERAAGAPNVHAERGFKEAGQSSGRLHQVFDDALEGSRQIYRD